MSKVITMRAQAHQQNNSSRQHNRYTLIALEFRWLVLLVVLLVFVLSSSLLMFVAFTVAVDVIGACGLFIVVDINVAVVAVILAVLLLILLLVLSLLL